MTVLFAIILAIVEGLTEFLPVSSTGHLILTSSIYNNFFNNTINPEALETFEVFIQLGAILAVVYLYFDKFKACLDFQPNQTNEFKGFSAIIKIGLGCAPAFIIGFLIHDFIKQNLFSVKVVGTTLIVGGVIMILLERYFFFKKNILDKSKEKNHNKKDDSELSSLTYLDCFKIGCFQILALCPGVSRSASTIIGGMVLGRTRSLSAEFSFILAVPVIAVAALYDLYKGFSHLSFGDLLPFSVGLIVSFIVAVIAIKGFVKFLQTNDFVSFGVYRIIVGVLVLVM